MIVGMIEHLLINVKVTKEESVVGGGGGGIGSRRFGSNYLPSIDTF